MYLKIKELLSLNHTQMAIDEMLKIIAEYDRNDDLYGELFELQLSVKQLEYHYSDGKIDEVSYYSQKKEIHDAVTTILKKIKKIGIIETTQESDSIYRIDNKHWKILFVGSNPVDTGKLDFGSEVKAIRQSLKKIRNFIDFTEIYNPSNEAMLTEIITEKPDIMHYSGHYQGLITYNGLRDVGHVGVGRPRQTETDGGLLLCDEHNNTSIVPPEVVFNQLRQFKGNLKCVVLNACYSDSLAQLLSIFIPFVIGIRNAASDEEVINFTKDFYKGLALNLNIEESFKFSCSLHSKRDGANYTLYKIYN